MPVVFKNYLSIFDASGPGNVPLESRQLAGAEEMLICRVGKNREHRFLVRNFRAKRIDDAGGTVGVSLRQRMIFIAALEKFVNDYALVNQINPEVSGVQITVTVTQVPRIAHDCLDRKS